MDSKKQRNKCVKIRRKSIKTYKDKVSQKSTETSVSRWSSNLSEQINWKLPDMI